MKKHKLLIYGIVALALSFLLLIPTQGNIFSFAAEEEPIIYIGEITGNNSSNKDKKSISTRSADNYNLVCRNYETNNDVSATYATKAKSDINSNIYTTYDQSGNMWNHGGTSSKKIRGTIVYDGIAENIDVDIPWLGYKTSESVTIKGVTFTLRCGPNKVSIKASSSVLCNGNTTFFAFGVA